MSQAVKTRVVEQAAIQKRSYKIVCGLCHRIGGLGEEEEEGKCVGGRCQGI